MDENKKQERNKGGRPKKAIRKDQQLAVMCNLIERKVIEGRAKNLSFSVSEYLRITGMSGQAVSKSRALPKEVLLMTGVLNHIAANLNQIAKKRNLNEELDALERAKLQTLRNELSNLTDQLKKYYQ